MREYSYISSLARAEISCKEGHLKKAFLLPTEFGGEVVPENIVYLPPDAWDMKNQTTAELHDAIASGMSDIQILPEYLGASFVPAKLIVTAARPGHAPEYRNEIWIWQ